jgi:hypothetical protein
MVKIGLYALQGALPCPALPSGQGRARFFLWVIIRAGQGRAIAGHRAGQGKKSCPVTVSGYHFKKEWLSHSNFFTFLRECKTDRTKALWITCNIQFSIQNSGLGDINHHIETKEHQERTKSAEANLCKT